MSKNKFTEGEWFFDKDNDAVQTKAFDTRMIARIGQMYMSQDEHIANAQLIAAAPELLEACEEALHLIENILTPILESSGRHVIQNGRTSQFLKQVIEKAKGENSGK